jgi:hypothetical protein
MDSVAIGMSMSLVPHSSSARPIIASAVSVTARISTAANPERPVTEPREEEPRRVSHRPLSTRQRKELTCARPEGPPSDRGHSG